MNKIKEVNPEAFEWTVKITLDKWTRSHDSGKLYGSMTTNTIKSVNNMLKGFRALPITSWLKKFSINICITLTTKEANSFSNNKITINLHSHVVK